MNRHELDELAASTVPEEVHLIALRIWRKQRHRQLRTVQLCRIVKALAPGAERSQSRQYWRVWGRLHGTPPIPKASTQTAT